MDQDQFSNSQCCGRNQRRRSGQYRFYYQLLFQIVLKRKMSLLARSSAILPANLEPPAAKLTLVPLTPMVLNPRAQIAWAMTVAVGAARILVDACPTTVGDAVAAEQSTGYICLSLVLIWVISRLLQCMMYIKIVRINYLSRPPSQTSPFCPIVFRVFRSKDNRDPPVEGESVQSFYLCYGTTADGCVWKKWLLVVFIVIGSPFIIPSSHFLFFFFGS